LGNGSRTFFVDRQGRVIPQLPRVNGVGILSLTGELIKANIDSRISYLRKDGTIVWNQQLKYDLGNGAAVSEKKYRPDRNTLVYYPEFSGLADSQVQAKLNKELENLAIAENPKADEEYESTYESNFEVDFHTSGLVSIKMSGYDYTLGAAHGMPLMDYYHISLKTGKFYSLSDLFKKGSNYKQKLNAIVKKQIQARADSEGLWPASFTGIESNQQFILHKDSLEIYFYPYEVGPYAAGFPMFKVPFAEIRDLIDIQGEFWAAIQEQ